MGRQAKREVINLPAIGVEARETNVGCGRVVRTGAGGRGVDVRNAGTDRLVKAAAVRVAIGVVNGGWDMMGAEISSWGGGV